MHRMIAFLKNIPQIKDYFKDGGYSTCEIGISQKDTVLALFQNRLFKISKFILLKFLYFKIVKDYSSIDRVIIVRKIGHLYTDANLLNDLSYVFSIFGGKQQPGNSLRDRW